MRYNIKLDKRINMPTKSFSEVCSLPVYVPFSGEFTDDSARKFRESLETAENMALDAGQDIIPVTIDSPGGSVYALMGMIDAVKSCSLPIATIVESKAMSCGAFLFSYGAKGHRYIGPHATVLIHPVSSMTFGKIDDMQSKVKEGSRLNDILFEELTENCGQKKDYFINELKERRMSDWHLTPKACIDCGLANHIRLPSMSVEVEVKTKFG